MPAERIHVLLHAGEAPTVVVDGTLVPGVEGVQMAPVDRYELPRIQLLIPAGQVEIDGETVLVEASAPAPDLLGWLRSIDPAILGRDALQHADMGDDPTALVLRQLRRYAGDQDV